MYSFLASDLNLDGQIASIFKYDNLKVSRSFIICADEQLYYYFLKLTGLKSIKKCGISCTMDNLKYGNESSFETSMGINLKSQWIKVCWKSKSGIIYHLHDEVDCNDIEFWLEDIDVPLLYQQLYGPTTLPFKLPPVHYQLIVGSLSIALDVMIQLKEGSHPDMQHMEQQLNDFLAAFNAQSEKKDRKDGVVHNWRTRIEGLQIIAELDLGSAGAAFFKKLLKWLHGFEQVEKVVMGNTPENQK